MGLFLIGHVYLSGILYVQVWWKDALKFIMFEIGPAKKVWSSQKRCENIISLFYDTLKVLINLQKLKPT